MAQLQTISHPIHLGNKAPQFLFLRIRASPSAGCLPHPPKSSSGVSWEEETEAENHISSSGRQSSSLPRPRGKVPKMDLCVLSVHQ